jgi:hypothetical protein
MKEKFCKYRGKRRINHRVIWEKANGPVPEGYEIHHINGNHYDNNLDNLIALSAKEHLVIHMNKWWPERVKKQNRIRLMFDTIGNPFEGK